MKNLKFLWLFAVASVLGFSSCDKNNDGPEPSVVTFESVTVPAIGYLNNESYAKEGGVTFTNVYDATYATWSGFAVSSKTDKTTAGYGNQYSVYGTGGAAGSKQFAVCYYSSFVGASKISFASTTECNLVSVAVNNGTYGYLSMKNGDAYAKKFEAGDWFKVTFSAFNAAGVSVGTVDYYLADFRNGKSYLCENWATVDLSSLQKVNRVEVTLSSSDNGSWGMNTPAYFCVDNLKYYAM